MKQQLSCSSPLSFPVSFRQYTKVSKLTCLEKHPFHLRFQILKDYPSKASSCFLPENVSVIPEQVSAGMKPDYRLPVHCSQYQIHLLTSSFTL